MKNLLISFNGAIICICEIVVGILLLINPAGFTTGIIIGIGALLMLLGFSSVIKYFIKKPEAAANGQFLMKGLLLLLTGVFFVFKTDWLLATFPAMTALYGVAVLVTGISKIQLAFDMLRRKNPKWYLAIASAAAAIVCAVIILKRPFDSLTVLWRFTGILLICESLLDFATLILSGKLTREDDDETALEVSGR